MEYQGGQILKGGIVYSIRDLGIPTFTDPGRPIEKEREPA